jgi:hypothetical protein
MVDATDGFTPETGLTIAVTVSKNGGAFASGTGTVTQVGNGLYFYEIAASEIDTLGFVAIRATATGARDFVASFQVVSCDFYDVNALGLSRIDATITSRAAPGAAMTLTTSERDSIATSLLDLAAGVETSLTVRQFLRVAAAVLAGRATVSGSTVSYKRRDGTTEAVAVTHGATGERTGSTLGTL